MAEEDELAAVTSSLPSRPEDSSPSHNPSGLGSNLSDERIRSIVRITLWHSAQPSITPDGGRVCPRVVGSLSRDRNEITEEWEQKEER